MFPCAAETVKTAGSRCLCLKARCRLLSLSQLNHGRYRRRFSFFRGCVLVSVTNNSVGFFFKEDWDPRLERDPDSFQDLLCLTHPLKRRDTFFFVFLSVSLYLPHLFSPRLCHFVVSSFIPWPLVFPWLCFSLGSDGQLKWSGPLQSLRGRKTYSEAVEIKMKSN